MAEEFVLNIIGQYLHAVNRAGINVRQAVLFGSWARGDARANSDIDLVVISPDFDNLKGRELISRLWQLRVVIPEAWRIEPIACGERQWLEDDASAIIEIARQEGELITYEPEAA